MNYKDHKSLEWVLSSQYEYNCNLIIIKYKYNYNYQHMHIFDKNRSNSYLIEHTDETCSNKTPLSSISLSDPTPQT